MPSFRLLGFVSGSLVALTAAQGAASASVALTWGQPGGGGQPNATFSITRIDLKPNAYLIAPCAIWLRASNLSGFSVTEPPGDTNVYDPTQHRINFIWDFGDPGYVPRFTPNIPTVWRNTNIAYGKSVAHVFAAAGNFTVTCWAFDDSGNWGTATYTFGPGGNAGPILSQADAFSGSLTVCYDPDGPSNGWAGAPVGASLQTTVTGANTALSGGAIKRLLFRRGQTYTWPLTGLTNIGKRDAAGLYIGAYGSGAEPVINTKASDTIFFRDLRGGPCVLADLDCNGDWDATTETGIERDLLGDLGSYCDELTLHRCRISGFAQLQIAKEPTASTIRNLHDTVLTNWKDYGVLAAPQLGIAFIGCDWYQHLDALAGISHGTNSQSPIRFGNSHGPWRGGGTRYTFFSCSSFFNNCGWSSFSGDNYGASGPPTLPQATIRFTPGQITYRTHDVHDRCSHEGMGGCIAYATFNWPSTAERNHVVDKCLFIGTAYTTQTYIRSEHPGFTVRNCYFYRPNIAKQRSNDIPAFIGFDYAESLNPIDAATVAALIADIPMEIYNNTAFVPGPTSNIGSGPPVLVTANGGFLSQSNNVLYAPDLTLSLGTGQNSTPDFRPVDTTALSGVVCRFKGGRWNFPPIGGPANGLSNAIPVTSVREGGAGTVNVGDWVRINYPDYTGMSGGALGQVTRAIVVGNSGQKHEVSINTSNFQRMGDAALWPEADNRVKFDFPAGQPYFRIQNTSGAPWITGNIWVKLDLRDYLMAPEAGSANPASIPGLILQAGSAGVIANRNAGIWAHGGFFADYRQGVKTPPSGASQTGKLHRQGAFA